MRKFAIVFLGTLLLLACSDNQKEVSKTFGHIIDSAKIKETILIGKRKKGIINDWVITDNFYSDTIVLTLLDSSTNKTLNIITFNKNGSINYSEYNSIPRCGNGIYYLDSTSNWKREPKNTILILTLSGGINMYSKFKKKIEYRIDTSQFDKLILIKSKIYYDKEMDAKMIFKPVK